MISIKLGESMFKKCLEKALIESYTSRQSLVLLEISFQSISYAMHALSLTISDLIEFVHEQTFLYAVHDPPDSLHIFSVDKCDEILTFFMQNFGEELIKLNFFCNMPELSSVIVENNKGNGDTNLR